MSWRKTCVHCLTFSSIGSNLEVRIGDNALARDLFPADYHCLGDNENRPIKWLSLEAIEDNQYSTYSDVVINSTFRIVTICGPLLE